MVTTVIGQPTAPTTDDLQIASVQPPSGQGVVTFPVMTGVQNGQLFVPTGLSPAIQVDLGNDGNADGKVPLLENANLRSFVTTQPIVLPVGDSKFSLTPETNLGIAGMKSAGAPAFWVQVPHLDVACTVFNTAGTPTWTLPASYDLKLNAKNGQAIVSGSRLTLTWAPSMGSVPPHFQAGQQTAQVKVDFYYNSNLVMTATKVVPIVNNVAVFEGSAQKAFTSLNVSFDLREAR
jgi:hypothetical protein